jgi:Domain of unknown function (DUF4265)
MTALMYKLLFEFLEGGDWPPVTSESLWVERIDGNRYRVENVPFFAKGVSCGDEIVAESLADRPMFLTLESVVRRSRNSTLRIIVRKGEVADARSQFAQVGCTSELSNFPKLFAVDIPFEILREALALAERGFDSGHWDYEDGFIYKPDSEVE